MAKRMTNRLMLWKSLADADMRHNSGGSDMLTIG